MLISLDWLNDYVDVRDVSPETVAETLTQLGLEVERITTSSVPIDDHVVVGKILEAVKHPNADTLRCCKVDIGNGTVLEIVCGAPNAREGIYVPVATVGAVLPGDFKIKASKIRGIASNGMICAEDELKLSDVRTGGIMELKGTPTLGAKLSSILPSGDTVLEVSLTPNRGDCLSYVGIARELAAKLNRKLKTVSTGKKPSEPVRKGDDPQIKVVIESGELCSRFVAFGLDGVKAVTSPLWLRQRLQAAGMRAVNAIVDCTNYVLLEWGQPIHAYDTRHVAGSVLEVRSARLGETMRTLDGAEIALQPGDVLICDKEKIVGLAGIMGGENSAIREDTTSIIVEVAQFAPGQIRRTTKRLGLSTEASQRFEKGIDLENVGKVAQRVSELLLSCLNEQGVGSGVVSTEPVDHYTRVFKKHRIALRLSRVQQITGLVAIKAEVVINRLESLGVNLLDKTAERMLFEIPSWRFDLVREIDLIEEIARLEGYDKVPYLTPKMAIAATDEDPFIEFIDRVKAALASLGLNEAMTYPFVAATTFSQLKIESGHPLEPTLRLANPLSEELAYLRTSLVPSLLQAVVDNRRWGRSGSKLFEVGRGYFDFVKHPLRKEGLHVLAQMDRKPRHLTPKAAEEQNRPTERVLAAGIIDQPWMEKGWSHPDVAASFYHMKGILLGLFKILGMRDVELVPLMQTGELPFVHPKNSGAIRWLREGSDPILLGWCGELHPECTLGMELGDRTPILFELDLEGVFTAASVRTRIDTTAWKFPAATRDIALAVNVNTTFADLQRAVEKFPQRKFLRDVSLFDVYTGDKIALGQKSLAANFVFQSHERTLTDKEVEQEVGFLVTWLEKTLAAKQR